MTKKEVLERIDPLVRRVFPKGKAGWGVTGYLLLYDNAENGTCPVAVKKDIVEKLFDPEINMKIWSYIEEQMRRTVKRAMWITITELPGRYMDIRDSKGRP